MVSSATYTRTQHKVGDKKSSTYYAGAAARVYVPLKLTSFFTLNARHIHDLEAYCSSTHRWSIALGSKIFYETLRLL
jgi:hypothetical protein